jgi:hypothetical protein
MSGIATPVGRVNPRNESVKVLFGLSLPESVVVGPLVGIEPDGQVFRLKGTSFTLSEDVSVAPLTAVAAILYVPSDGATAVWVQVPPPRTGTLYTVEKALTEIVSPAGPNPLNTKFLPGYTTPIILLIFTPALMADVTVTDLVVCNGALARIVYEPGGAPIGIGREYANEPDEANPLIVWEETTWLEEWTSSTSTSCPWLTLTWPETLEVPVVKIPELVTEIPMSESNCGVVSSLLITELVDISVNVHVILLLAWFVGIVNGREKLPRPLEVTLVVTIGEKPVTTAFTAIDWLALTVSIISKVFGRPVL